MLRLLNIGCGERFHPDWVNIDHRSGNPADVRCHDLTKGIPFASDSFDAVYHSHFLEHLPRATARFVIEECLRVLKPGGILRIVVPDLEYSARLYLASIEIATQGNDPSDTIYSSHYEWAVINLIDQMVREYSGGEMVSYCRHPELDFGFVSSTFGEQDLCRLRERLSIADVRTRPNWATFFEATYWAFLRPRKTSILMGRWIKAHVYRLLLGQRLFRLFQLWHTGELHKWMYDQYSLRVLVTTAGFSGFRLCTPYESGIRDWAKYGLDVDADGKVYKPNSLFAEALK